MAKEVFLTGTYLFVLFKQIQKNNNKKQRPKQFSFCIVDVIINIIINKIYNYKKVLYTKSNKLKTIYILCLQINIILNIVVGTNKIDLNLFIINI